MVFSRQFPQTITTNLTSIPTFAQFKIENPLKVDLFCNGIEIVTTPEFSRKGVIIIRVNGVDLYDSRRENAFSNVAKMAIPLDAVLERDRFVEIFAFNSVDSNTITCTVTIFLDQISKTLDSSFEYLSTEAINDSVSKTESLFEFRIYSKETIPKLLNMEGYKKLIVLFASESIAIPIDKTPEHENTYIIGTTGFSGGFTTTTSATSGQSFSDVKFTNFKHDIIFDLRSTSTKQLQIEWDVPDGDLDLRAKDGRYKTAIKNSFSCTKYQLNYFVFFTRTFTVVQSDDQTFLTGVTNVSPSKINVDLSKVNDFTTTKRFIKIEETTDVNFEFATKQQRKGDGTCFGTSSNVKQVCGKDEGCCKGNACDGLTQMERIIPEPTVKAIFDSLTQLGTAQLSFEVRNADTGLWNEFISTDEFGTVTNGEKVTVQIGDVTSKTAQGKTFALPSSQTDFRAVLTVKDAIETGVTIIKVS